MQGAEQSCCSVPLLSLDGLQESFPTFIKSLIYYAPGQEGLKGWVTILCVLSVDICTHLSHNLLTLWLQLLVYVRSHTRHRGQNEERQKQLCPDFIRFVSCSMLVALWAKVFVIHKP